MVNKVMTAYIMNTLRILKAKNPGDTYYEEYIKHSSREGDNFYDQYHFAIDRVISEAPARILEVGVRTGLSICNMLSAYRDYTKIKEITLCDIWNDGWASPEIVKMNMRAMNFPELPVNFIVGDSAAVLPELAASGKLYDYILIDGDHSKEAAARDLRNAVPLCDRGGVIVFDDISPYGCNLWDVWENFAVSNAGYFEFGSNQHGKGTAWAIKK